MLHTKFHENRPVSSGEFFFFFFFFFVFFCFTIYGRGGHLRHVAKFQ